MSTSAAPYFTALKAIDAACDEHIDKYTRSIKLFERSAKSFERNTAPVIPSVQAVSDFANHTEYARQAVEIKKLVAMHGFSSPKDLLAELRNYSAPKDDGSKLGYSAVYISAINLLSAVMDDLQRSVAAEQ
jgi:hypothetical protein